MSPDVPILLGEDDDNDAYLLRQALVMAGVDNPLIVVSDGTALVDYFLRPPPGSNPLPGVIVLDLNMPRMDGFEVLAWISTQPDLKKIPVVVLSASDDTVDQEKARHLGAVDYKVKPFEFDELVHFGRELRKRFSQPPAPPSPRPGLPGD